jgi:hypothetical protein
MKASCIASLVVVAAGAGTQADPIGQVVDLLNGLSAKVASEGEADQAAYEEYFSWCDDTSKEKQNEITTSTDQKAKLEASIQALTSTAEVCDTKIKDLVAAISANGKDLAAATKIREDEEATFSKNDAELVDVIQTIKGAISKLAASSASASFAQVASSATMANTLQSIKTILDASSISGNSKQKLAALLQAHEESDEDDSELGAPAAANYEKKSGDIVAILGDMQEQAETQMSDLRKAEQTAKNNYQKLKQSIEDQIANDGADKDAQAKKKAAAQEGKATAEGELEVTIADLKSSSDSLAMTQKDCMQVAIDHQNAVAAMHEELRVLAEAVKIIKESTGSLVQTSFFQTNMEVAMQSVQAKVAKFVRQISQEQHSTELAQLASRIVAMSRSGAFRTSDPFVKIRGMIEEMIAKLEDQMGAEAQEKAYCDEEMAKTEAKKSDLETTSAKLTNKIDTSSARSAQLKEEVADLQAELSNLAKNQAAMDKTRQDANAVYIEEKAALQKGLAGIRQALELLRNYFGAAALVQTDASQPAAPAGHQADGGAGGSIISILEVAESDMAKELTKVEMQEADEVAAYEHGTDENKMTGLAKNQDVKYKTQEAAGLDKAITELSNDRDSTNSELASVNAYYTKLQGRCVAKPTSYEEKKKARDAEIAGLKEALNVLENEAALVQRGAKGGRNMRGALQM